MIMEISSLLNPLEVRKPMCCIMTTSPSSSNTSLILMVRSDNKIIPEMISLKVCCNPSPIPTNNAAEPANKTVILMLKVFRIKAIAITQTIYLII